MRMLIDRKSVLGEAYCRSSSSVEELDRLANWLLATCKDSDCLRLLQATPEYHDFFQAAQKLEKASRRVRICQEYTGIKSEDRTGVSFLHNVASDEILLRVFDFLDSISMVQVSKTCKRCYDLANESASTRTRLISRERQLHSAMKLLCAQEQINGYQHHAISVPVPILLLSRRVLVTNCGDPDYNGIYQCTGFNGNGYVFSKPLLSRQWIPQRTVTRTTSFPSTRLSDDVSGFEDDLSFQRRRPLQCIISKRFSAETILWYMSKEVLMDAGELEEDQVFSFWVKLMVTGEASPDICRYPSQSSILGRDNRNEGWQSLSTTHDLEPPIVELMDHE